MNSKIKSILLLIITIAIFILFMETTARIILYFFPEAVCSTFSDPNDVFLCRLESQLSKSLERYNQSTVHYNHDICDKWDAQLGWIPKPNCRSPQYSTNSQGFRGTNEFKLEKNRRRIALIGDSFTWGENNLDEETYSFYLYEIFNENADIINMGVHGYGPEQSYIYFMRDGLKYKPDTVIFGLFLPVIHRTILKVRDFFKPRFIIENGALKLDPDSSRIPDLKTAMLMSSEVKKKSRFYSLSFLYGSYNKFIRMATSYNDEVTVTLKIIEELNKQLKKENIELIVLLIPEQEMVEKDNADYYGVVPKITMNLEKNNIGYINLQPVFEEYYQSNNQSLYKGHLKPIGNRIIANELFKSLGK